MVVGRSLANRGHARPRVPIHVGVGVDRVSLVKGNAPCCLDTEGVGFFVHLPKRGGVSVFTCWQWNPSLGLPSAGSAWEPGHGTNLLLLRNLR